MDGGDSIAARLWSLPKQNPRKPRRAKPLERSIKKSIEAALNKIPGVHVTVVTVAFVTLPSGKKARVGLPGQGDLVGGVLVHGLDVVLEVEVKRPGEVQLPSQRKRQALVESRSGCYAVATNSAEAIQRVLAFRARHEARP